MIIMIYNIFLLRFLSIINHIFYCNCLYINCSNQIVYINVTFTPENVFFSVVTYHGTPSGVFCLFVFLYFYPICNSGYLSLCISNAKSCPKGKQTQYNFCCRCFNPKLIDVYRIDDLVTGTCWTLPLTKVPFDPFMVKRGV